MMAFYPKASASELSARITCSNESLFRVMSPFQLAKESSINEAPTQQEIGASLFADSSGVP